MKRALGLAACAFLTLFFLARPSAANEPEPAGKKRILYLNSYHNGYAWSDAILEGIRGRLAENETEIDLQIEYLDAKKYDPAALAPVMLHYVQRKFMGKRFDVVIASDNDAYNFMLAQRDRLFPGVPVVFCGVNEFRGLPPGVRGFTGIVENFDFAGSLDVALRLHPGRHKVLVIGDLSTTGLAIRAQIEAAAASIKDKVQVEYLSEYGLNALFERVATLKDDTILYLIPMFQDFGGQFYSAERIAAEVNRLTSAPVYSNWEFLLGHGIVGGRLLRGQDHGRMAADRAISILGGADPHSLGVDTRASGQMMFDHIQLKRFRIRRDALPQGSIVINEPKAFYELNKQLFWTFVASFVALAGILVMLAANIRQRKAVEVRIKDQLSFLQLLMDTIPIPICFTDRSGRYQGWNTQFGQWFGPELEAARGKDAKALAATPLAQLDDGVRPDDMEAGQVRVTERRMQSADGSWHDVVLHKAAYAGASGRTGGMVAVIYDLSPLRRAEDDLRAAEEKYRGIFENSPLGIFRATSEGRYLEANPALVRLLGYAGAEEFRASGPDIVGGLKADPEHAARLEALGSQGLDTARFATRFTRKDGRTITANLHIRPIFDALGRVRHYEGLVEDVTAQADLERQLMQSQKMEAIGTLAGGIAHDFNNILTSILNSAELALMDLPGRPAAWDDLERVIRAANRGSALIRQILAFSRPSQEGFRPVNAAEVMREVLSLVRASMPRNIVVKEAMRTTSALCMADPTQLHQVVMNCVTNAFQALRATGGSISLGLDKIDEETPGFAALGLPPGRYLKLSVADDGPGIPAQAMDKIFDPFFTTKGQGEGTGLGLSVALGIVKAHKGTIQVESLPGRTVFDIYVPQYASKQDHDADEGGEIRGGAERILFVEDDEDQLAVIPRVLEGLGYTVRAMGSADEAAAAVQADPLGFDLVLTDFDMPDTDGLKLAERLMAVRPELPVILVSGRMQPEETALGRNIRRFLRKPYDRGALARAIREALAIGGDA